MLQCFKNPSVVILILCQALSMSGMTIILSIGGTLGWNFTGSTQWSTVPITLFIFGTFALLFLASYLCGLWGRKNAFLLGAFLGIIGGLLFYQGVVMHSFVLVCIGIICLGSQFAFTQYYRFAVSELVSEESKAFAMSLVVGGGVFASFLGPLLVKITKNIRDDFSLTALAIALLCALQTILLLFYSKSKQQESSDIIHDNRNITDYLPRIHLAIFIAISGFSLMTILMNAAPVAMQHDFNMSFDQAVNIIQWHVFAMYFPSFFTGYLIKKFGPLLITLTGLGLFFVATLTGFMRVDYAGFLTTLVLIGVGWNFCYLASSYLLVQAPPLQHKSVVQGANDVICYSVNLLGSLLAGIALNQMGWMGMNLAIILVVSCLMVTLFIKRRYILTPATHPLYG